MNYLNCQKRANPLLTSNYLQTVFSNYIISKNHKQTTIIGRFLFSKSVLGFPGIWYKEYRALFRKHGISNYGDEVPLRTWTVFDEPVMYWFTTLCSISGTITFFCVHFRRFNKTVKKNLLIKWYGWSRWWGAKLDVIT